MQEVVGLFAFIAFVAAISLPLIVGYWKGTTNLRFATLPLVWLAFVIYVTSDMKAGIVVWLIAWVCALLSIKPIRHG